MPVVNPSEFSQAAQRSAGGNLIMVFEQIHAEWPNKRGGVALAFGNIAGELGRVHSLLCPHIPKGTKIENNRQSDDGESGQGNSQHPLAAGNLEPLNAILDYVHALKSLRVGKVLVCDGAFVGSCPVSPR